ncbi:MAG: leucine-rich repeat domain-containing protein, partial [Firmicutes bacterium]|nr:leucine-rich repeat domain-containing protein [Bacillota bacterium]
MKLSKKSVSGIMFVIAALALCIGVFFTVTFSMSAADVADSGTCGDDGDNLTWTLKNDGTLTISGSGKMKSDDGWNMDPAMYAPWYSYCESITSVIIEDGVTSVGYMAFSDCANLESVAIPESVTSIDSFAFRNCTSLEGVTIPESVTVIGHYAFRDCTSLESIVIPDSVTTIDN